MAWTDPRTWVTGELVTAALLNSHLRDNLDTAARLIGEAKYNTAADFTTTSTSFVDVDATNLSVAFTVPSNARIMWELEGAHMTTASQGQVWGVHDGSSDVVSSARRVTQAALQTVSRVSGSVSGLTPGASMTYKWRWKVTGASTATLSPDSAISTPSIRIWQV